MIFNKNGSGSDEIKGIIGWIYKSNSYGNLVTYLRMAERHVIRIIGKDIYKLADEHYASDNYEITGDDEPTAQQLLLDELVHLIQLPIALLAYRKYAPGVDLQHGEDGRQIIVTDNLKPAFEWMIERDNLNIIDLYHEAIEMLLEFLDEQAELTISVPVIPATIPETFEDKIISNIIEDTWRASAEFEATKSLFINKALEFDQVFPINGSRRLYLTMVPFIREVENQFIRPAILASNYDAIKEKIKDQEDLSDEEKKMIELSRAPIALITMSIALKRLSMELLPDRVVQNYSSFDPKQHTTADSADRRGLASLLERDGRKAIIPLQNFIKSLTPVAVTEEVTDTTKPFFLA